MTALKTLQQFDTDTLPNLDTVVFGALEFFKDTELPALDLGTIKRPLVVGSGNAEAVGRLIFTESNAVFADEGTFEHALSVHEDIDAVIVVSASGSKHSVAIVQKAGGQESMPTFLITNNPKAPAAEYLKTGHVQVLPKVREPYTYNTSTYMGMLLARSGESPASIQTFIETEVVPKIPKSLDNFDAFFLIVPPKFDAMRSMFATKFDELFGPKLVGRVFTLEQAKHAKTVIPSESECFVSFGEENILFGNPNARIHIPLPKVAGPGAMMAIGYYVIGHIQKQLPPYFKDNIVQYTDEASKIFGQEITPIVE